MELNGMIENQLLQFTDNYFNLISLNLKNRNQKARNNSLSLILHLFKLFFGDKSITENDPMLARMIAGLGTD